MNVVILQVSLVYTKLAINTMKGLKILKENKIHSRSIRMTETVKNFVESRPGNGFNDKFENTVLYCISELPKLNKTIEERKKRLQAINDAINKLSEFKSDLEKIIWYVEAVKRYTNDFQIAKM